MVLVTEAVKVSSLGDAFPSAVTEVMSKVLTVVLEDSALGRKQNR